MEPPEVGPEVVVRVAVEVVADPTVTIIGRLTRDVECGY